MKKAREEIQEETDGECAKLACGEQKMIDRNLERIYERRSSVSKACQHHKHRFSIVKMKKTCITFARNRRADKTNICHFFCLKNNPYCFRIFFACPTLASLPQYFSSKISVDRGERLTETTILRTLVFAIFRMEHF